MELRSFIRNNSFLELIKRLSTDIVEFEVTYDDCMSITVVTFWSDSKSYVIMFWTDSGSHRRTTIDGQMVDNQIKR